MAKLQDSTGFEWDEGNADKNWVRHRVSQSECEQVFFNQPLIVAEDWEHSLEEDRFYALGRADADRRLFVVFTLRGEWIRIISARDMMPQERREYEHARAKEFEADSEIRDGGRGA
jgi:hypothetical protein